MGQGLISITPHKVDKGSKVTVTIDYSPPPGGLPPNDFHLEYQRDGGTWVQYQPKGPSGAPIGPDFIGNAHFSWTEDRQIVNEGGTYKVRLWWTLNGAKIPGSEAETTVEVSGCFIATAAYGSALAPEVEFLRDLRDKVLRATRWGSDFFAAYWKYYYPMSGPIAAQMERDPEFRSIVRWSLVEPWTHYMRLVVERPDWDELDVSSLDPKLRIFLDRLRNDMERWLSQIELPKSFAARTPIEAVQELNVALGQLLRSRGLSWLRQLRTAGVLPLLTPPESIPELRRALENAGRKEEEIMLILDDA